MLELLPDWLREHIDKAIHTTTGATVVLTGISFDEAVSIFPAAISALVSVVLLVIKMVDTRRKRKIYMEEERKRTDLYREYLKGKKDGEN